MAASDDQPKAFFGTGAGAAPTERSRPARTPPPATPSVAAPHPARPSLPIVGLAVGIALVVGTIGGAIGGAQWARLQRSAEIAEAPRPSPPPVEARAAPSVESRRAARTLAGWHADPADPLGDVTTAVDGFTGRLELAPPYDALNSAVFDSSDQRVRLARILSVGRNEICADATGRRFACGLQSRAALQNLVAKRAVVCDRLFVARDERRGAIDADCSIDGIDLAEHLIRLGFAFPSPLAGDHHRRALAEARARSAGVWAGPYEIPDRDRAEDDIRAIPFGSLRLPATDPATIVAKPPE